MASYEQDLARWAEETAGLIRDGQWQQIDLAHLVEELEELSKREQRAIASQLVRLLLHLLKWHYQPARRSDSWLDSITDARLQIELALLDSPSLRGYPEAALAQSYARARRGAAAQTGYPLAAFPETCPYQLTEILAEDWLPDR